MYLIGFAAFLLLGRMRIKRATTPTLTLRELDDMLFYGVLGVILADVWATCCSINLAITWGIRWKFFTSGKAACPSTAVFSAC